METRLALNRVEEATLRAGDPFGLLKRDAVKNLDTPELTHLRHRHEALATQMRDFADEVARRGVMQIAKELDFPPENVHIISNPKGRMFEVGGKQWEEGGHFSPGTGVVQINIATSRGLGLVRLVAHEIAHAKFEVWRSAMDQESEVLKDWEPVGLKDLTTRNRTPWSASGEVRPEFRAEFRRRFPAHAATADTWGSAYTATSLSRQMQEDDGFTDYSKAYWADANNPAKQQHYMYTSHTGRQMMGSTLYTAVNETLSEVAAWRVARRMQPGPTPAASRAAQWAQRAGSPQMKKLFLGQRTRTIGMEKATREPGPSKAWRKFSARINQFYRAHGRT
jgi:hypothetical protein